MAFPLRIAQTQVDTGKKQNGPRIARLSNSFKSLKVILDNSCLKQQHIFVAYSHQC